MDGLPRGYDNWRTWTPYEDQEDLRDWQTTYTPSELDALTHDAVAGHADQPVAEIAGDYDANTVDQLVQMLAEDCTAQLKGIIDGFEEESLYLSWADVKASLSRVFAPVFVKAAA